MSGAEDSPSHRGEPVQGQEPAIETDGQNIKKDLLEEEILEKDLLELEREAEELDRARARRKAILEREGEA